MGLEKLQNVELPASADMHVHLRDGAMMEVVVPTIRAGGVDTVLVMVCFRVPSSPRRCSSAAMAWQGAVN